AAYGGGIHGVAGEGGRNRSLLSRERGGALVIDLSTLHFDRTALIAEIGNNHEGDLERAYALARLAVESGADIVKFQTFRADSLLETGKPLILATAMCDQEDVEETMEFIRRRSPGHLDSGRIALLQCTAMYESPTEDDVNLSAMTWLRERFRVPVGYSNHAIG